MTEPGSAAAGHQARAAWSLFDWAAQPYHTLITAFIFAPYFATALVGDATRGQALWGYLQAATALAIAVAAPAIGGLADRRGQAKPLIAILSALYLAALVLLWWAVPGAVVVAAIGVGIAGFAIEIATVLTNAMLPGLARPGRVGALSGGAWALGYIGGLVSLALVLSLLAPMGTSGMTILGIAPIFGLDPAEGEPARATALLSAVWYAVFALPLFLFVPSGSKPVGSAAPVVSDGLRATLKDVRTRPGLLRFLVARMFFQDALLAVFAFGGLYGSSLFGWGTTELGAFGILLTVTGSIGAWFGGRLDDRIGAKPVLGGAIVLSLITLAIIAALEPPAIASTTLFASPEEQLFLIAGALFGVAGGPLQSASRTYLARSVPPERIGAYFGLYAFSGKAVAFTGPLLVALATDLSGSQRAGLAPIAVLFVIGLLLLLSAPSDRSGRPR